MSSPPHCPYLALRYFEEQDSHLFYGRDEHVRELLSKLELNRFVAVLGSSGSGKSSLVRAGLLPELKSGMIPSAGHRWKVIEFKPGSSPMQELGRAFELGLGVDHATETIAEGPLGIARAVDSARLEIGANVLIIADQFEEIFSYLREEQAAGRGAEAREQAQALVRRLLDAAAEPDLRIYVLLVMRSDYLGDCAQFPDLPERMNASLYLVPRLRRDQLQRAIEAPVGRDIEPAVVQRLLGEVGTDRDQLPRLQHLLNRMWYAAGGGRITLAHYAAAGGWKRGLEQHLDRIYEELTPPQQEACRLIFQRLSEIDRGRAVRRWATREQLAALCGPKAEVVAEDVAQGVIEPFHREGFLRLSGRNQDTVDVMHESVLRGWPRLVRWMEEENRGERRLRELAAAARETGWHPGMTEPERKAVQGIAGLTLRNLINWRNEFHPTAIWASRYLDAGEFEAALDFLNWCEARELDRQRGARLRTRVSIAALAFLAIVLSAAATGFYMLGHRALMLARKSEARELVAYSVEQKDRDPERSILLAMYAVSATLAYDPSNAPAAITALHGAILASQVRLTLRGHTGPIYSVAFSPDGRRLATASFDKTAKIWDTETGKELMFLSGHEGWVWSVAFSPDGRRLATASMDKTVKIWDAETGKELMTLRGHEGPVWSVAFSPDGRRLATGSDDKTAKLWDAQTGKDLMTLRGHEDKVESVAFSPDGRRVATGSDDKTAKLWDAQTGKKLMTLLGHYDEVASVAFSPDGKRLATASTDETAKIWDAGTGRELMTLRGHANWLYSAAFSPDGRRLATASEDRTAKIWDAQGGKELVTLRGHEGAVGSVAFRPDGRRLATASADKTAKIWDAQTGKELMTLRGHEDAVWSAAFSPDGSRLATGSWDKIAKIWDAETGKELMTLRGHEDWIYSVAFSPDGRRLATASKDSTTKIWDAGTGKELMTLRGHAGSVLSVAYSPDGRRLATTSFDKTTKIWDAGTGKELMTLQGHGGPVLSVAFSTDGRRLATGSWDNTAKIWDSATGKELMTLRGHAGAVWSVVFSPDGKRVATASADQTAEIWDAVTGKELTSLLGHEATVFSAAFSPDGSRLATASLDATVQVYPVDLDDLLVLAHSRVTRDLTPEECKQYFDSGACPKLP